jgi:VWFA-related protein
MAFSPRAALAALLSASLGPALLLPAGAQAPSEPTPAFPAGVEVVTVDVVVVDGKGRAVPGFQARDFTVLEDGQRQAIATFQAVELPPLPPPAERRVERARVSTNVGPEAQQVRSFVVVFDDVHLSPEQALRAKAVVGEFLRTGVREGDRVTLIATAGGAWWTARMPEGREELVKILQRLDGRFIPDSSPDRLTDYEAMRIMVYDDPEVAYAVKRRFDSYGALGREKQGERAYADTTRTNSAVGIVDPYVRARAQDAYRQATERRKITLGVMARALRSLTDVKGRKAMILVSQGFIHEQGFAQVKELVDASTRANAPVHFVDTRGLKALPDFMTASFKAPFDVQDTIAVLADISRESEGAESMALDTGGLVVKNTNDVERGMLRISAESQAFYLLGYTPTNPARDGRFRKIEVKLDPAKARGLRVRARRGYYAPGERPVAVSDLKSDPDIVRALDSPFERREIPLRVSALSFDESLTDRLNVVLAVDIDLTDVRLEEKEGRFEGALAFLVEAQHRETGEYYRTDEKIEMSLSPETRARVLRDGHTVSREFSLAPGGYQVKVVVRDLEGGRIGSVIHEFEVPPATQFRLSSPIVSDVLESPPPGQTGPPRPVLKLRRRVPAGGTLWVQYSVLGASKSEATQLPRVSAGYEIRRPDGTLFRRSEPTPIIPTSIGSLLRLSGINLAGAAPGTYELVIRVRDELAGRDVEARETFEVAAS